MCCVVLCECEHECVCEHSSVCAHLPTHRGVGTHRAAHLSCLHCELSRASPVETATDLGLCDFDFAAGTGGSSRMRPCAAAHRHVRPPPTPRDQPCPSESYTTQAAAECLEGLLEQGPGR